MMISNIVVFQDNNLERSFFSKCLLMENGNGFDLVKQMQPSGNLHASWTMFDHVKHVQDWTTFTYHVYNLVYYKVMTIAIWDMQSEYTEVQCVLWWKLNKVMLMKGVSNRNFKGFMVDSAQANWKVIRIMYGSEPMVDKERMCYFH